MHDFLDNLGAQQYEKLMEKNATKEEITNTCEETYGKEKCHEETYYNSESEGKDFKDNFYAPEEYGTWQTQSKNNNQSEETFINTCEETFGKKNCHEETYLQEEGTSDQ